MDPTRFFLKSDEGLRHQRWGMRDLVRYQMWGPLAKWTQQDSLLRLAGQAKNRTGPRSRPSWQQGSEEPDCSLVKERVFVTG